MPRYSTEAAPTCPRTPPRSLCAAGCSTAPESNRPGSPSCAPGQTTTAPRFPGCTPPSGTCPSCPDTVHPLPYAATVAAAGWPRNVPSTVNRCRARCSRPAPSAAPPAAPRRSHSPAPPRPGALPPRPHRVLKPFTVRRLAGQLGHLFRLHSALRAIHPIQFHHHRALILKDREIPNLPFIHLVHLVYPSCAARTDHAAIPPLAPDPQLQTLVLFVDLLLIDPVSRKSQHPRPVVLHDQPSLVVTLLPPHLAHTSHFFGVPGQADGGDQRRFLAVQRVKKVA